MEEKKELSSQLETIDVAPEGVNPSMWQKFQKLRKRRQDMSSKSTAKRIKQIQKEIIEKVTDDFEKTDDIDVLRSHNIDLPGNMDKTVELSDKDKNIEPESCELGETTDRDQPGVSGSKAWMDFKPYIDINAHLKGVDRGKCAPKTGLEEKIDKAIELGDFSKAEQLSDHLSTRDLGAKVADAFDAKRYAEKKKEDEERLKAKKQKKLKWGFDHKQRWETKSNM